MNDRTTAPRTLDTSSLVIAIIGVVYLVIVRAGGSWLWLVPAVVAVTFGLAFLFSWADPASDVEPDETSES